jgi:DNA processing protein
MMHDAWIIYSQDPSMSLAQLKKQEWQWTVSPSEELVSWIQKYNVAWTIDGEKDFPYKALCIKSKPYMLYYLGNIDLLNQPILGIVWPRNHSEYARLVLDKLFSLAGNHSLVTISGLAIGVDQLCHRMSMEHNIPTIAVLGGGLRRFLRSWDRALIQQIVDKGWLVISECKLDQQPQVYTFPQRNRIIAWLSDVVFLPEAGPKSGSLITADFALAMGKPVYGVPNTIFSSTSAGVNHLIASWAIHAVTDIQIFLDTFFPRHTSSRHSILPKQDLSPSEQTLVSFLWENTTCSLNDFFRAGSFSSQELISLLTLLEMKHCIYQTSPGVYKIMNN